MITTPDLLRDLYQSLSGKGALPLEPDDPYYGPSWRRRRRRTPP